MKFEMLSCVWINALRDGKPSRIEGEINGRRAPNTLDGEAYDVLLPEGCVAPHHYRAREMGGDPRVCVNVPPGDLEFSRGPERKIDIPAASYRAGQHIARGVAA